MKIKNTAGIRCKTTAAMTVAALITTASAFAQKPDFIPSVWGDGQVWGTKATAVLPAPNEKNKQSYDVLFIIINSNAPEGQLPVSEAAPGNVHYNGGRWITATAWWTEDGLDELGTVPVLTSYADILSYSMMGYLDYEIGSPDGGPPPYFQCPLLPVK